MRKINSVFSLEEMKQNPPHNSKSSAVKGNRLEALRVLSNSLLHEIEEIRKIENAAMPVSLDLAYEVGRFEISLIRSALLRTGGSQRQAARLLNVKLTTLNTKIKRYKISINDFDEDIKIAA